MKNKYWLAFVTLTLSSCTSDNGDANNPMIWIIVLLVMIGLYLALRPVFLWYWEVNSIKSTLERQTQILEIVFQDKIEEYNKKNRVVEQVSKVVDGVMYYFPEKISDSEKNEIIRKSQKLQTNQLLIMDSYTRRIEIWIEDEFKESKIETMKVVARRE